MININKVKTYSVNKRFSKVKMSDFAKPPSKKLKVSAFLDNLPEILKAKDFKSVVNAIVTAHKKKKAVIVMLGAHVIKCGLNPVLIELIKKKVITCIAINGACLIHDFELAYLGKTSEDVTENLQNGSFGMAKETADFINNAIKLGVRSGLGAAESVAKKIHQAKLKNSNLSLLYNAYKFNVPVCAHIAIGTDIIHQHPSCDGSLTGEGTLRDFKKLTAKIKDLNNGGVVLNFGSAVILPEVFLKALNLSRNLGSTVKNFTTANFDMIYHYRPSQNVVMRPTQGAGKGYYIIGHHEIMIPLLAQAVIEKI